MGDRFVLPDNQSVMLVLLKICVGLNKNLSSAIDRSKLFLTKNSFEQQPMSSAILQKRSSWHLTLVTILQIIFLASLPVNNGLVLPP